MKVSIGICAYNEEQNIGKLLARLGNEPLLDEIIVVTSGCTDNTVSIATEFSRVKVWNDFERRGKAVAVNQFIEAAKGDVLILESADTLPTNFCFKHLLAPFADNSVGMVGAHPIPVDSVRNNMGKVNHLLWKVHHQIALRNPKSGEVCAFRNIIKGIDPKTPVDEASIESQIIRLGYRVIYAPGAVVFNKGCGTIKDFIKQRKRIYYGHLALKQSGYTVPSMSWGNLARASLRAADYKHYRTLALTTVLEGWARLEARREFRVNGYEPKATVWEVSKTTKEVK